MKKYNLFALAILAVASTLWITSCAKDDLEDLTPKNQVVNEDPLETRGPSTTSDQTTLAGIPLQILVQEWWKYALSFDCQGNPPIDPTVLTGGQNGSVTFLTDPKNGAAFSFVNITRNKALLVPVMSFLKNDPCPGNIITPAPGGSIFKVVPDGAEFVEQVSAVNVTLNGRPILTNRIATDLFYFTGNKELYHCLGTCVTGESQPAASDGYWVAIPSLPRGKHQLRVHSEIPSHSIVNDVVYLITVR